MHRVCQTALEGKPTAWFAPTYKMLSQIWREMKLLLGPLTLELNEQEKRIGLRSGGHIDFWSLDVGAAARGRKYARVAIDEAAMVPDLEETWHEVIRPTLTDLAGDAFFASTPKGLNFFHRLYQKGIDPDEPAFAAFQRPTAANPFIPPAEIAHAREELPDLVFRQEYLAEFLSLADSAVFRNVEACLCAPLDATPAAHAGHRICGGLDWGQAEDFTALSLFCADCREEVFLDRYRRLPYAMMRDRIKAAIDMWGCKELLAELNAIGVPNCEALRADGVKVAGFMTTAISKPQIIQSLALCFERAEAKWLSVPWAAEELRAYEIKLSPTTGRPSYGAPEGGHDDSCIARALAWKQGRNAPPQFL